MSLSGPLDSIGQGGDFAKGPASIATYDTSPSGLGIVPTYLGGATATATAASSAGAGAVVALASFPPSSPVDGQTCILELPSTYDPVGGKKIRWGLVYNSSDSVWDFTGGALLYAEVLTKEGVSGPSAYVDLATVGPALTIPRDGDYEVSVGCDIQQGTSSAGSWMAYAGAGLSASDDDACLTTMSASTTVVTGTSVIRKRYKVGMTAGTLTAKYKSSSASGGFFSERWIAVVPVRIT